MKDKKQKTFWLIINIIICLLLLILFLFIWQVGEMIDDHGCWVDGYQTEHCQKYIRGNK
jgi:hypothetical protein